MHMITVSFGSNSCPLLFKTAEAAEFAWAKLTQIPIMNPPPSADASMEAWRGMVRPTAVGIGSIPIDVSDDFGRHVIIVNNFNGAIMEDMAVAQEGQIEIGLHQARTQVKAQQRGSQDPVLRAAQMQQQSPAMIHPGLNGNGRMF